MRLAAGLLAVLFLVPPADAGRRRDCRRHCGAAIAFCINTGNRPHRCRVTWLRECRRVGLALCDLPPVTTTSTTTSSSTSSTGRVPTTSSLEVVTTVTTSSTTTSTAPPFVGDWTVNMTFTSLPSGIGLDGQPICPGPFTGPRAVVVDLVIAFNFASQNFEVEYGRNHPCQYERFHSDTLSARCGVYDLDLRLVNPDYGLAHAMGLGGGPFGNDCRPLYDGAVVRRF